MKKIFFMTMLSLASFSIMAETPAAAQTPSADLHHNHRDNPHRNDHHRNDPHRHEPAIVIPSYSQEEVTEIASCVKKLSFDNDKMAVAKMFVKVRPITVSGLESIAKSFTFDDNRRDFLAFAYDYCVDKESYYKLRKVFDFSSNAEKLFNKLGI